MHVILIWKTMSVIQLRLAALPMATNLLDTFFSISSKFFLSYYLYKKSSLYLWALSQTHATTPGIQDRALIFFLFRLKLGVRLRPSAFQASHPRGFFFSFPTSALSLSLQCSRAIKLSLASLAPLALLAFALLREHLRSTARSHIRIQRKAPSFKILEAEGRSWRAKRAGGPRKRAKRACPLAAARSDPLKPNQDSFAEAKGGEGARRSKGRRARPRDRG